MAYPKRFTAWCPKEDKAVLFTETAEIGTYLVEWLLNDKLCNLLAPESEIRDGFATGYFTDFRETKWLH